MKVRGKQKLWVIGVLIAFVTFVSLYIAIVHTSQNTNPFTANQLASVQFPIYYPMAVPKGYRIIASSVTFPQDGVIVYDIKDAQGRTIYISQEARVSTYNYGQFFKGFTSATNFTTPLGQAISGYLNNGHTVSGSLVTQKTWLIVDAQAGYVTSTQIENMIRSLTTSH